MAKGPTPFLWFLFSAGGTLAALLYPVHLLLTGFAFPLGVLHAPAYDYVMGMMGHPLVRLYFFVLIALPLWHWAHRFRYTLYDALQTKHLTAVILLLCYGGALAGTILAGYTLWTLP
jgi:fumarate reductase subunit D